MKSKELILAEIRLSRTVDAAYHALLEMSAWMGIPQSKRMSHIKEHMSNVIFCAENNVPEDLNIVSKGGIMEPTVGRIVHFHTTNGETHAAIITAVWSSDSVNLAIWNKDGSQYQKTSVSKYTGDITKEGWDWPPRV